uniref:Uncharacterized protein n=1 Tax=Oryza sativa subsp. japonica TaxID=39947 RepID=Q2RBK8_ORYSJ|nr:hypothetical protein LOC_Os11g01670 [Oryza sativa Japonica Group]
MAGGEQPGCGRMSEEHAGKVMREAVTNLAPRASGREHGIHDAACPIEVSLVDEVSARELCGGWPAGGEEACEARWNRRRNPRSYRSPPPPHPRPRTRQDACPHGLPGPDQREDVVQLLPCWTLPAADLAPAPRRRRREGSPPAPAAWEGKHRRTRRRWMAPTGRGRMPPLSSIAARGETMEAGSVGGQARVDEAEADGANREREVAAVVIHARKWRDDGGQRRGRASAGGRGGGGWRRRGEGSRRRRHPWSSSMVARGKATEAGGMGGRAREDEVDVDGADGEREDVTADLAPAPSAVAVVAAWGETLLLPHRRGRRRSPASRHLPLLPGTLAPPAGLLGLRRKSERKEEGREEGKDKVMTWTI